MTTAAPIRMPNTLDRMADRVDDIHAAALELLSLLEDFNEDHGAEDLTDRELVALESAKVDAGAVCDRLIYLWNVLTIRAAETPDN